MSVHPVTPMHEADLRLHLARQGLRDIAGLHYPAYDEDEASLDARLDALIAHPPRQPACVLLDMTHAAQLARVGRLMWRHALQSPLLAVGPSSVVQALAAHWRESGQWQAEAAPAQHAAPPATPLFVLAGSLSPVTARQIAAAGAYTQLPLDAARLASGDTTYRDAVISRAAQLLQEGRHVIAGTALGPHQHEGQAGRHADTRAVALACADLLKHLLARMPLKRVGIAGGDTSSLAVQALDLWGLSFVRTLAPGVALNRAHSDDPALDGMELMLKGGQMGPEDLFERLLK
jgi:uncharacterized protein YgbK (DUF1537 family)